MDQVWGGYFGWVFRYLSGCLNPDGFVCSSKKCVYSLCLHSAAHFGQKRSKSRVEWKSILSAVSNISRKLKTFHAMHFSNSFPCVLNVVTKFVNK